MDKTTTLILYFKYTCKGKYEFLLVNVLLPIPLLAFIHLDLTHLILSLFTRAVCFNYRSKPVMKHRLSQSYQSYNTLGLLSIDLTLVFKYVCIEKNEFLLVFFLAFSSH